MNMQYYMFIETQLKGSTIVRLTRLWPDPVMTGPDSIAAPSAKYVKKKEIEKKIRSGNLGVDLGIQATANKSNLTEVLKQHTIAN